MSSCPYCNEPLDRDAVKCEICCRWFADRLIAQLDHAEPCVRESAAKALVYVVSPEEATIVFALARALRDSDQTVRRAAGITLFIYGAAVKHVVPELLAALDDDDLYVRRTAAAALSNVGDHGRLAIPRLSALKNTDDALLRSWVVEALNRIGV